MAGKAAPPQRYLAPACVAAVLVFAGCGEAGTAPAALAPEDGDSDTGIEPGTPALYLDRIIEQVDPHGANPMREGYRARLENCLGSDAPTTALSREDEERLGTRRWRTWRKGDRYAFHDQAWVIEVPAEITRDTMCAFAVRETGKQGFIEGGRSIEIDLETGERLEGNGDPSIVMTGRDVDVAQEARDALAIGMSGPTPRTVAGLPCDEWRTRSGSAVCVWSGGTRWGMTSVAPAEVDLNTLQHFSLFVLEVTPPEGREGLRLSTVEARTGVLPEESELAPGR